MNAIEFRDVSVSYRRHAIPTLKEWAIRTVRGGKSPGEFSALRNITLDVTAGESLGVVGGNGAGKSTLLRVAAGIITPSSGECLTRGTMAPLLELGTGFDIDLTGRENILFNGALLGRSRKDMTARAEEIIEFSGLAESIDSPLRTYSTGMVARLAFAVSTAVDAEIVLLDEILAVGDASFVDRCEDRIRSFVHRGATMVIVSHNMASLTQLCRKSIWIDGGGLRASGDTSEIVKAYNAAMQEPGSTEGARHASAAS